MQLCTGYINLFIWGKTKKQVKVKSFLNLEFNMQVKFSYSKNSPPQKKKEKKASQFPNSNLHDKTPLNFLTQI